MRNIPDWLKIAQSALTTARLLSLSNGSSIKAASTSGDAGRSEALSLLVLDEAAHIEGLDDLWTGLVSRPYQLVAAVLRMSTPNGVGNWFHKTVYGCSK